MEMDKQTNDGQCLQKRMEDGESCLKNLASYFPSLKCSISKLPTAINTVACDHELATLAQGFQTYHMWEQNILTHSQQNIQRKQRMCLVYVMGASNLRLERGVQVCQ